MHVTVALRYRTPADAEPEARVVHVHDSLASATAGGTGGYTVLPVAWAASAKARRPKTGEILSTSREGTNLVAVVAPLWP